MALSFKPPEEWKLKGNTVAAQFERAERKLLKEAASELPKAMSLSIALNSSLSLSEIRPSLRASPNKNWELPRKEICQAMYKIMTNASGSSQDICGDVQSASGFDNGSASRGAEEIVPYCGRVGAVVAGQKLGISSAGRRSGSDLAASLSTCAESAWEAACDSGLSGQYITDPNDPGYGELGYATVPWACFCTVNNACVQSSVLAFTKLKCTHSMARDGKCG